MNGSCLRGDARAAHRVSGTRSLALQPAHHPPELVVDRLAGEVLEDPLPGELPGLDLL